MVTFAKTKKVDDSDANKILISKEEPYSTKHSFKNFVGYNYDDAIKPLCTKLPQMIRYVRKFEINTTMSFKINDSKLLKRFDQIWKKVEKLLRTEFDSKSVYVDNDKYMKTKIKIYSGTVNFSRSANMN